MATGAGIPIGGSSSHRGFGVALGLPQFELPSRNAALKRTVTQRASSTDQRHNDEDDDVDGDGNGAKIRCTSQGSCDQIWRYIWSTIW